MYSPAIAPAPRIAPRQAGIVSQRRRHLLNHDGNHPDRKHSCDGRAGRQDVKRILRTRIAPAEQTEGRRISPFTHARTESGAGHGGALSGWPDRRADGAAGRIDVRNHSNRGPARPLELVRRGQ